MRHRENIRRLADALSVLARRRQRWEHCSLPSSVGVLLQWGIGDAVLTVPLLRAMRLAWPEAQIDFLGKPWLADLFSGEGLADGFAELVPPWTKYERKYRIWEKDWRVYGSQLRKARRRRYDLVVGIRWDVREVAQLRLLRAVKSAGFARAGGAGWIAMDLRLTPVAYAAMHRSEAAAYAAQVLTGKSVSPVPHLSVRHEDRVASVAALKRAGHAGGHVVAVHSGAGALVRRWPMENYDAVLRFCSDRIGCLVIIDDGSAGSRLEHLPNVPLLRWSGPLAGLKSILSVCDVLLCNDSGPMHLAAAVGCRVVSIFGPGAPRWFGPVGVGHRTVYIDPMPCRPCFDRCIYDQPICMKEISVDAVAAAATRAMNEVASPRITTLIRNTRGHAPNCCRVHL